MNLIFLIFAQEATFRINEKFIPNNLNSDEYHCKTIFLTSTFSDIDVI